MNAAPSTLDAISQVGEEPPVPFATVFVTLTKQEHIRLVTEANYWKTQQRRAKQQLERNEPRHQVEILRLKQKAAEREKEHRVELVTHANRWRFVLRRARERASGREQRSQQELWEIKGQAAQREALLRSELDVAQARIRDLQKRLFGRKSECRTAKTEKRSTGLASRPRGHQHGAPGHGRTMQPQLDERVETLEMGSPQCPKCGLAYIDFPGTEDSEVLEIDVCAYRRVVRRRRYRAVCHCGCVPGIVSAPPPSRLINRGKFGISVWATVLLDKFLYGRPSHRLLQDLAGHNLIMSAGSLAGGLKALAPLFAPIEQALTHQLRGEPHWHADETRWAVFVDIDGKVGHRWYLWVFHSRSVVHYVLDGTRSTKVVQAELAGVQDGVISCDRYAAYKKFARLNPGIVLAFCWAHQRRDFLECANSYPALKAWAMVWVDAIAELYRFNELRLQSTAGSAERAMHQSVLEQALHRMSQRRDAALSDSTLALPAAKVLNSMAAHWSGLTVFATHPWVPMDNNVAERDMRSPVVGRKNFYGSGSEWSGQLAATMYSILMTVQLWGLNARTWLAAYLQACADNSNHPPDDLSAFLPWTMDATKLAAMRTCPTGAPTSIDAFDST
jgi:transposase